MKPKTKTKAPLWAWTLASWFGSGFSPFAPGTAGTAASLPLAWTLGAYGSNWMGWNPWLFITGLLLFYPGALAATKVEAALGKHDPGVVVVDETVGTLWTLAFLPAAALTDWRAYVAAFFLFRILDVWKPGLIRDSQALPRGWGVMIDDALAGLLGGALLAVAWRWLM